ncbi:unnamed protein product [Rotaria sp. Silwood1]|nr:unnamed protein product [Rotaria sp. Silwood1]
MPHTIINTDHYKQISNESIYVIPFEQIQPNLSCIYCDDDDTYYRSAIIQIDQIANPDIIILKIYLVDYEIYDCRLANIHYPQTSIQWHEDASQFINNFIRGMDFSVEMIGYMNPFYCIYLWIEQKSINELLVQHGYAIEFDDSKYSTVRIRKIFS